MAARGLLALAGELSADTAALIFHTSQEVMAKRFRDSKGRFCKRPPAPPLDPAFVAELGHERKAVDLTLDHRWEIVIEKRWTTYSHEEPDTTPTGETS
jgi:hypothetical protein